MRHLFFLLLCPSLAFASPSPDSLLKEANALYLSAKLPSGAVTEANLNKCIEDGTSAQGKLDLLFTKYPTDPVSNSFDAKRLQGKIKGALAQCQRIKKDLNKKPYEPKDRGHSANF